jgi:predicted dehydrogenase
VNDVNESAAKNLAAEFSAKVYNNYEALLDERAIHLVYIASPPFLHHSQSRMALQQGKHVICEKPAALHANEAEDLAKLAATSNLLYVVNLMQRYNRLFEIVRTIINERLLGDFLHGFFENYASDENLGPDHWFWNDEKSGGIFIEHGVHFFDLFAGWLGKGKLIHALRLQRPNSKQKFLIDSRQQCYIKMES